MHRAVRIIIDIALVVVFAAIGRASHAEALDAAGLLRTAMPFVGAALLVWIVIVLTNRKFPALREGLVVWACTLVLGMVFRVMVGDGIQVAFVAVAALVLALFLIGWRAIWWFATRGRPGAHNTSKDASRSGNPAIRDRARRDR